jgi:hypothetical protein
MRGDLSSSHVAGLLLNLPNSDAAGGFSCLVVCIGRGYPRMPNTAVSVASGLHSAPIDVKGY